MEHRARLLPLLAGGLLLMVGPARAGVPSPANSSVPACLAICPLGDLPFTVVVRDLANTPLSGASVVLDFSSCTGVFLCPQLPADPYLLNEPGRTARMFTDASGAVSFPLRAGGVCPGQQVNVFANGTLLAMRVVSSPDQDGDGQCVSVIGADDPIFASKLGTSDPTADFDCSGAVDATDQQIFFSHHSHSCLGIVDATLRSSWGRLKLHYR